MPKSRKRKIKRGSSASRTTYSSRKKSKKTAIIVYAIIGGLVIATIIFLFTRGGGGPTSQRGDEPVGVEVTTPTGLKYTNEVIGTGITPKLGQTVTVHYTGTLEDGTKFASSIDSGRPDIFPLSKDSLIEGWVEALTTMKVGGKRKLIIPPQLGYGDKGKPPKIPPNATLLFEIELLDAK